MMARMVRILNGLSSGFYDMIDRETISKELAGNGYLVLNMDDGSRVVYFSPDANPDYGRVIMKHEENYELADIQQIEEDIKKAEEILGFIPEQLR